MVYGFAGQSGGTVRIASEVGNGTMICLYPPRHAGSIQSEDRSANQAAAQHPVARETILVVDDEPLVRMVAVEMLEELGYDLLEAEDGPTALRVLEAHRDIALLVSDVGLPNGMNGRQLADAAGVSRPELKVLFITGYAENAVLNYGDLDRGMQVLTKPFASETLARRVN